MRALFPWVPLGLLFLAPFVDPKRPLRLIHLDLLVLVGFAAIYLRSFEKPVVPGWYSVGAVAVGLGLLYIAARALYEGCRRRSRSEALIPYVPVSWLAVAVVLVAAFRLGYALDNRYDVFSEGGAGVVGAELITHGKEIYDGGPLASLEGIDHGDTYGPLNYLAYVPFEQAFPSHGEWRESEAARVAAAAFDLLTLIALFILGRRLRPGEEGKVLGVAFAYAWVTYPYTLFVLAFAFSDALVALLLVLTLIALASPVARGACLGLATAAKFAPAALALLLARGVGRPSPRSIALFWGTFLVVVVALFVPFIPDGGPREIYDRTMGFQAARVGCCGYIAKTEDLGGLLWLKTSAEVAAVALAVFVVMIPPRPRTSRQVAALGAAVIAAFQFAAPNWLPSYAVWLAPLVFVALLTADDEDASTLMASRPRTSDASGPG